MSEPVIVAVCSCCPVPRRAFLADVLVVAADHRLPAIRFADLFVRYPGLTIVLIAGRAEGLAAGIRDGAVLTLRCRDRQPPASRVRIAAVLLYTCWSQGITPGSPRGARWAAAAGFHVDA